MLLPTLMLACALPAEFEPDSALRIAMAIIGHQEESIRTWIVEYTCDIRARTGQASDKGMQQLQRSREARRGPLFRRDFQLTPNALISSAVEQHVQAFDGDFYRSYSAEHRAGGITSNGVEPTGFTQNVYLSTQGLGAMLQEHAADAETTWTESGGRQLLSVSWDENGGYSRRTLHLDPECAYQPRRYTLESEYPEGAYSDGRERGILVGEIQKFLRQDQAVLPSVIVISHAESYPQGRTVKSMVKEVQVLSMKFNPEIGDSEFTIEFPDGTTVRDKDRKVKYVVGQPDSEQPLNARPAVEDTVAPDGPPYEFWSDWRIWMGFCMLCLGLLIWFKRKGFA